MKNRMFHTPTINNMLDFIRKQKVTNMYEMVDKGHLGVFGGNRTRLYDALRSTEGFIIIFGKNRFSPAILAYDDGSNDKRLIVMRLHKSMKMGERMNKKRLVETIAQKTGDIDGATKIADDLFNDRGIRSLMKGKLLFSTGNPKYSEIRKVS